MHLNLAITSIVIISKYVCLPWFLGELYVPTQCQGLTSHVTFWIAPQLARGCKTASNC